ncbi:MAG: transposase [Atopobiaceae bacterium]|jgi:transposase-like protein|nr:transposase [Atopobiaceae bacterium]MCH4180377.1 transposase [Atopobiaceae bacterium]MCH4214531.1 transposase [Atopobiaceae bacterium]MCH4229250.1 transposase [Atopobiaceae bacterium]MCH4276305.1 transposase [Atopobiaceae bacterium]
MDSIDHRRNYTYDEKLSSVQAHVEDGVSVNEAMKKGGIESKSAFFRWCSQYRREGAEALRPKKRGRPCRANG